MILDQAFDYMAHGYNVIPILKQTKLPPIKWKEYQTQKATREEWEGWSKAFQGCNLAVVCGAVGRVVVVDADNAESEVFCKLYMTPTPFRVRTRKGVHFYYRHPGTPVKSRTRVYEKDPDGYPIDIRGDGGLATGLGSIHETGHHYHLDKDSDLVSVLDLPIYNPDWFPEKVYIQSTQTIVAPGDNFERASRYMSKVDGAGKGTRNYQAYKLSANLVKDFALTFDQALNLMDEWGQRCDPPMDSREIHATLKSAVQTGRNQVGSKL